MIFGLSFQLNVHGENTGCSVLKPIRTLGARIDPDGTKVLQHAIHFVFPQHLLYQSVKVKHTVLGPIPLEVAVNLLNLENGNVTPLAVDKVGRIDKLPMFSTIAVASPDGKILVLARPSPKGSELQVRRLSDLKLIHSESYDGEAPSGLGFHARTGTVVLSLVKPKAGEESAAENRLLIFHLTDKGDPKLTSEVYTSCMSIYGAEHLGWLPHRAEVIAAWNSEYDRDVGLEIYSSKGDVLFSYTEQLEHRPGPSDLFELQDIQVSNEGASVCLVYASEKIRVFQAKTAEDFKQGSRLLRYPNAFYDQGAFAPDERWFFVGGLEFDPPDQDETGYGVVHVWDLKERRLVARYRVSNERVVSLAVSPDGRWLAVSDSSGRLQVLELPKQFHKTP